MKTKKARATDVISIRKDINYSHIQLHQIRQYGKDLISTDMTLKPEEVPLPVVNKTVVFIKDEFLFMLVNNGIVTEHFREPVTGIRCGFISDEVFKELTYSPMNMYTKKISSVI